MSSRIFRFCVKLSYSVRSWKRDTNSFMDSAGAESSSLTAEVSCADLPSN